MISKFKFLKDLDYNLLMHISHTTRYVYQSRTGFLEKNNLKELSWGAFSKYNPPDLLKKEVSAWLKECDSIKKLTSKDRMRLGAKQAEIELIFLKMFTDKAKELIDK